MGSLVGLDILEPAFFRPDRIELLARLAAVGGAAAAVSHPRNVTPPASAGYAPPYVDRSSLRPRSRRRARDLLAPFLARRHPRASASPEGDRDRLRGALPGRRVVCARR